MTKVHIVMPFPHGNPLTVDECGELDGQWVTLLAFGATPILARVIQAEPTLEGDALAIVAEIDTPPEDPIPEPLKTATAPLPSEGGADRG